jgi:hypothetical protein
LQTIHRVGGWVSGPGRRKNKEFTYVKSGTRLEQGQPSKSFEYFAVIRQFSEIKPILTLNEPLSRPVMTPASMRAHDSFRGPLPEEKATDNTMVVDEDANACNSLSNDESRSIKEKKSNK